MRKLKVGDVVRLDGEDYVCDLVNESRARCRPLQKKRVALARVDKSTGEPIAVEFEATGAPISIGNCIDE